MKRSDSTTIILLDRDLRLHDHPALTAARSRGGTIVQVFVWSPNEEGDWPAGAASRWWLHHSLSHLQSSLATVGSRLIVRQGPVLTALQTLQQETQASAVCWNNRYEPHAAARRCEWRNAFEADGITVETFHDELLFDPASILTRGGTPYQVFTPFWKQCLLCDPPDKPLAAPEILASPKVWPKSLPLDALQLLPRIPWDAKISRTWTPGESGAAAELRRFLRKGLAAYPSERDRPDHTGTSRLSPHLHFGEISPRQIWHAVTHAAETYPTCGTAANAFLRQLIWREFAAYLLHHFPRTPTEPLREKYAAFPWRDDAAELRAWHRGLTGYPIVDAGMRQLWSTGWMHNRVRMIVGSFLVKDLLLPWQRGAEWFWDTLVDADLANNTLGWQWIAGCGADAAPYFRVFNPVLQGEKFDPDGEYVRRWVPELSRLPARWIHHPWDAPINELCDADIALGTNYPARIVDHNFARQRALAALRTI